MLNLVVAVLERIGPLLLQIEADCCTLQVRPRRIYRSCIV